MEGLDFWPDGRIFFPLPFNQLSHTQELSPHTVILQPYPLPGTSLPIAADSINIINDNLFTWDRPLQPGLYGISFHIRQFSGTNNPLYDNQLEANNLLLTNTLTRSFIITITEDMIVSLDTPLKPGHLLLFPNPARNSLWINSDKPLPSNFHLYDTSGKLVTSFSARNETGQYLRELDVSSLPAGFYLLSWLNQNGKLFSKKINIIR